MSTFTTIGKSVRQKEGIARVTGRAKYYADFILPGMLQTRILRSPYPAADVLSIDISAAEKMKGVHLVMTHENYPRAFRKSLYYVGDLVAAVVAVDETIAEEALSLIKVEYEQKKFVLSMEDSLKPNAPKVYEEENLFSWPQHVHSSDRDPKTGLYRKKEFAEYTGFGDIEQGFADADVIVEQKGFKYAYCKGPTMEPRGCTIDYDGVKLVVYTHSQGMHYEKANLAEALKLPANNINYVSPYTGGSYGHKNAHVLNRGCAGHYLIIASLACLTLRLPVHCPYSREEEMVNGWSRGSKTDVKIGFTKEGILTTMDFSNWQERGAGGDNFVTKNSMCATGNLLYSHNCRNLRAKTWNINTNRFPSAGWQGYGTPEGNFAVEVTMDIAAERLGIDLLELRKMNCMRAGDIDTNWDCTISYPSGILSASGIRDCIDVGAKHVDWDNTWKHPSTKSGRIRRGLGMAIFAHSAGRPGPGNNSEAIVKIFPDGSASLVCAIADIGQGQHTAQCQIVSEVLNIPYEKIGLVSCDTDSTPFATLVAASCGTWTQGWATYEAAMEARRNLLDLAAPKLNVEADALSMNENGVYVTNNPSQTISFSEVFGPRGYYGGLYEVTGHHVNNSPHPRSCNEDGIVYMPKEKGAQFVSLDVDTATGMISNISVAMVQNVGKMLNPKIVFSQLLTCRHSIENAILGNDCIVDKRSGRLLTPSWIDYRHCTTMECDVEPIVLEKPGDLSHPFGAAACGEGSTCPTLPAFSNAIYNAIGIRLLESPFTPERILAGLGKIQLKKEKKS